MAKSAVCAILSFMLILFGMAGIAGGGCSLIYPVCMTLGTTEVGMFPNQREIGVVMVEGGIPPAAGIVAGTAIRPKLSVVGIA